jgi:hypothetical protein
MPRQFVVASQCAGTREANSEPMAGSAEQNPVRCLGRNWLNLQQLSVALRQPTLDDFGPVWSNRARKAKGERIQKLPDFLATTGLVPVGRSRNRYLSGLPILRHHGACPRGALTVQLPSRSVTAPWGQAPWSRNAEVIRCPILSGSTSRQNIPWAALRIAESFGGPPLAWPVAPEQEVATE